MTKIRNSCNKEGGAFCGDFQHLSRHDIYFLIFSSICLLYLFFSPSLFVEITNPDPNVTLCWIWHRNTHFVEFVRPLLDLIIGEINQKYDFHCPFFHFPHGILMISKIFSKKSQLRFSGFWFHTRVGRVISLPSSERCTKRWARGSLYLVRKTSLYLEKMM